MRRCETISHCLVHKFIFCQHFYGWFEETGMVTLAIQINASFLQISLQHQRHMPDCTTKLRSSLERPRHGRFGSRLMIILSLHLLL